MSLAERGKTERTMTKRELARAAKDGAAGIIRALDISQLLGDEIADQIIDDYELQEYVELCRERLVRAVTR